ncbi:hypothetical protein [Streptomyces sp. OE57]|uniref:hypothetical protein n=1 Tax=Streptomyces lacaronensis TaxID=3379885 RepID=UPI0039B754FE
MAHGAQHRPRANLARAAGCEVCRGWGTVVTDEGPLDPVTAQPQIPVYDESPSPSR